MKITNNIIKIIIVILFIISLCGYIYCIYNRIINDTKNINHDIFILTGIIGIFFYLKLIYDKIR